MIWYQLQTNKQNLRVEHLLGLTCITSFVAAVRFNCPCQSMTSYLNWLIEGYVVVCKTSVDVRMKGSHKTNLVRFYIFIWSFADNDTKQLVTNLQCTTALQALGNNTLQTQFDCLISLLTTLINTKRNKSSPVRSDTKD